MIDLRIPRLRITVAGDDITPYCTSLRVSHPIEEIGSPLIWSAELEIDRLLADTLPANYFDNQVNFGRWAAGNSAIQVFIDGTLWQTFRVAQRGFSFNEITGRASITCTDLLGLLDNYQPPQLYRGIVTGGDRRWTEVVTALLLAAGDRVGVALNIDPVPENGNQDVFDLPRQSVDNFVREAQLIAGERGVWMWCDNEVIRWAVYPTTGQPFIAKSRYELLKFDRLDGLDDYFTRFLVDGTAERIARCPANEFPKVRTIVGGFRNFTQALPSRGSLSYQYGSNRGALRAFTTKTVIEEKVDTSSPDSFRIGITTGTTRGFTVSQIDFTQSDPANPVLDNANGYRDVANNAFDPLILNPPVPLYPQQGYIRYITTERGLGANAIPEGYEFRGRTATEIANKRAILTANILLNQKLVTKRFDSDGRLTLQYDFEIEAGAFNDTVRTLAIDVFQLSRPYVKSIQTTTYEYSEQGLLSAVVKTVQETRFFEDTESQTFIQNGRPLTRRVPILASIFLTTQREITEYLRECFTSFRVTILRYGLRPPLNEDRSRFARVQNPFGYFQFIGSEQFNTTSIPEPEFRPAPFPSEKFPIRQEVELNFPGISSFVQTQGYYQFQSLRTEQGARSLAELLGRFSYQRAYGRLIAYGYDTTGVVNYKPFQIMDAADGRYIRSNFSFLVDNQGGQAVQEFRGNLLALRDEVPAPPAPPLIPSSLIAAPLTIAPIPDRTFEAGALISLQFTAYGGTAPYIFSATPAIAGLSIAGDRLTGSRGALSATTITVTVTDSATPTPATASDSFILTIAASVIRPLTQTVITVDSDVIVDSVSTGFPGELQDAEPVDLFYLTENTTNPDNLVIVEGDAEELTNFAARDSDLFYLLENTATADNNVVVDADDAAARVSALGSQPQDGEATPVDFTGVGAIGSQNQIGTAASLYEAIASQAQVGEATPAILAIASQEQIGEASAQNVAAGSQEQIGGAAVELTAIGSQNQIGTAAPTTPPIFIVASQFASNGGEAPINLTIPAETAVGDTLLILRGGQRGRTPVLPTISGWQSRGSSSFGSGILVLETLIRVAVAGDAGSTVNTNFGGGANDFNQVAGIFVVRSNTGVVSVGRIGGNALSGGTITAASPSGSTGNALPFALIMHAVSPNYPSRAGVSFTAPSTNLNSGANAAKGFPTIGYGHAFGLGYYAPGAVVWSWSLAGRDTGDSFRADSPYIRYIELVRG